MEKTPFSGTILLLSLLLYSTALRGEEFSLKAPDFRAAKMAQSGDWAFPADSAGIAAYVKLEQVIDLEQIKPLFNEVKEVQENFIWGMVEVPNFGRTSQVHLYVDTDGWLVAFLKRDEPTAGIMQWNPTSSSGLPGITEISRTTLTDVLKEVALAIQVDFFSQIEYCHFKYPEANGLKIFVKIAPNSGDIKFTKVIIPQEYTLYEKSYYHYAYHTSNDPKSQMKVDGMLVNDLDGCNECWRYVVGFYDGIISNGIRTFKDVFPKGLLHSIEISYRQYDGYPDGSSGVAPALIYMAGE